MRPEEADAIVPSSANLARQAALSDSRLARHSDDRAPSLAELAEDRVEDGHLVVATHQRREPARDQSAFTHDPKRVNGLGLALQLERSHGRELERGLDLAGGDGTDDDAAAPGMGLQAGSGVDGVSEGVVALIRRSVVPQQNDGSGVDSDPGGDVDAVSLRDVLRIADEDSLHPERRAHGPLGVVLVRVGHAEEGVQAVAGELGNDPAEPLDLGGEQADDLVEQELRSLRAELLGNRG